MSRYINEYIVSFLGPRPAFHTHLFCTATASYPDYVFLLPSGLDMRLDWDLGTMLPNTHSIQLAIVKVLKTKR